MGFASKTLISTDSNIYRSSMEPFRELKLVVYGEYGLQIFANDEWVCTTPIPFLEGEFRVDEYLEDYMAEGDIFKNNLVIRIHIVTINSSRHENHTIYNKTINLVADDRFDDPPISSFDKFQIEHLFSFVQNEKYHTDFFTGNLVCIRHTDCFESNLNSHKVEKECTNNTIGCKNGGICYVGYIGETCDYEEIELSEEDLKIADDSYGLLHVDEKLYIKFDLIFEGQEIRVDEVLNDYIQSEEALFKVSPNNNQVDLLARVEIHLSKKRSNVFLVLNETLSIKPDNYFVTRFENNAFSLDFIIFALVGDTPDSIANSNPTMMMNWAQIFILDIYITNLRIRVLMIIMSLNPTNVSDLFEIIKRSSDGKTVIASIPQVVNNLNNFFDTLTPSDYPKAVNKHPNIGSSSLGIFNFIKRSGNTTPCHKATDLIEFTEGFWENFCKTTHNVCEKLNGCNTWRETHLETTRTKMEMIRKKIELNKKNAGTTRKTITTTNEQVFAVMKSKNQRKSAQKSNSGITSMKIVKTTAMKSVTKLFNHAKFVYELMTGQDEVKTHQRNSPFLNLVLISCSNSFITIS
ncbi:hypothetical protein RF11_06811 [Thelohanellus kitauei]|uniref:Uncharacterized protein n=1 Tax=Thelohanellus kitauei TaxID=669202 RepID=A0A0C2ISE2_THEKT|nr:hypothetical protein RF11_06811 [Thelohanellus kitauei]